MTSYSNHDSEDARSRQRDSGQEHLSRHTTPLSEAGVPQLARGLLGSGSLTNRNNAPVRAAVMRSMQGMHGNRAVQRLSASEFYGMFMGEGITDSGSRPIGGPVGGALPSMDFKRNSAGGLDGEGEYGPISGHADYDIDGVPVSGDAGKLGLRLGAWEEGGNTRYGGKFGGGALKGDVNKDGEFSGDFGVGTGGVEASAGDDGFTLGATGNMLEGSVMTAPPSADSQIDEQSRFGLSWGGGMAGRGHWGDKDNDGYREYGFGFDAGPVSADIKTEDPLRTGSKFLMDTLVPDALSPMVSTPFNAYMDNVSPDTNLTEAAYNEVADFGGEIYEGGSDAYESAGKTYNKVAEGAGELYEDAGDYASEKYEEAGEMYDKAKEYIPNIKMPEIEPNPLKWF